MDTKALTPDMTDLAAVAEGDGDHRFFLNHLATVKVSAGSSLSGMNVVEFDAPKDFGPPLHQHEHEDEIMFVISGEVLLLVGEERVIAGPGTVVSLPAQVPHIFQVVSESARFLTVTSGSSGRPTFDRFVQELGAPVDPDALPEPGPVDPGYLAQVAAAYDIEILGPPLAAMA